MNDLRAKFRISSWQMAVLVAATGIGSQIILSPGSLLKHVGQWAWISVLLSGFIYFFCAYLMLRLAYLFPGESFVTYTTQLLGKIIGSILIGWFILVFYLEFITILRGFSRVISSTMFSRTPEEAIGALFLLLCAYGASQSWGTIIKLQQAILFGTMLPLTFIWLTSLLNFQYEYLLPLLPVGDFPAMRGIIEGWNFYGGYEVILLVFPLLYRAGVSKTKSLAAAFIFMGVLFVSVTAITIAVLTSKMAAALEYPSVAVIKGVEIPGTFIERLEIYLLIFWIPTVYDTMIVFLAVPAFVLAEYFKRTDHRKCVWILAILAGFLNLFLDKVELYEKIVMLTSVTGATFSLIAVPLMLGLALLRKKQVIRIG